MDLDIEIDGWPGTHDWAELAYRAAEAAEKVAPELANRRLTASVLFTVDEDVRRLNREWRTKDKPTNVLSFPMLLRDELTGLYNYRYLQSRLTDEFKRAERGAPFTSTGTGAWAEPGAAAGPHSVVLGDGSRVTYSWYRFVDQPSFQQYAWDDAKKAALQDLVERLHRAWPIGRDYMPPPTSGELVALDPALFVTPPEGLEAGYVPIVTRQEDASGGG